MKKPSEADEYLTPFEAEHLVESINEIDVREYGSK